MLHYIPKTAKVQAVEDILYDLNQVSKVLKDNLVISRERMKKYADEHRTERSFQVGDWVLLKLQSYRQLSIRGTVPQK